MRERLVKSTYNFPAIIRDFSKNKCVVTQAYKILILYISVSDHLLILEFLSIEARSYHNIIDHMHLSR